MSNRRTLLAALENDPATLDDLTDATGWPQRKVRDTIGDLKNVGLVKSNPRKTQSPKPWLRQKCQWSKWFGPMRRRPHSKQILEALKRK